MIWCCLYSRWLSVLRIHWQIDQLEVTVRYANSVHYFQAWGQSNLRLNSVNTWKATSTRICRTGDCHGRGLVSCAHCHCTTGTWISVQDDMFPGRTGELEPLGGQTLSAGFQLSKAGTIKRKAKYDSIWGAYMMNSLTCCQSALHLDLNFNIFCHRKGRLLLEYAARAQQEWQFRSIVFKLEKVWWVRQLRLKYIFR